eukprot:TRINITY_DN35097_c0_g2_i1.p1 TRINITY_DN35097_c0_g2~~TRINITY_DN35097_c0_g2_i1.p1  ORF type:complete len:220 (+),score=26.38 TRINITY_DN35097_c0_g2_i1:128-787(+)
MSLLLSSWRAADERHRCAILREESPSQSQEELGLASEAWACPSKLSGTPADCRPPPRSTPWSLMQLPLTQPQLPGSLRSFPASKPYVAARAIIAALPADDNRPAAPQPPASAAPSVCSVREIRPPDIASGARSRRARPRRQWVIPHAAVNQLTSRRHSLPARLRGGWQVSLCESTVVRYPKALPPKEAFAQHKKARPVSPEASSGSSSRAPSSELRCLS